MKFIIDANNPDVARPSLAFDDGLIVNRAYTLDSFRADITRMNNMYELGSFHGKSIEEANARLKNFHNIFSEEVEEGTAVLNSIMQQANENAASSVSPREVLEQQLEYKTHLADWFGDLIVFAVSEATKFTSPINGQMATVADSLKHSPSMAANLRIDALFEKSKAPLDVVNLVQGPIKYFKKLVDESFPVDRDFENYGQLNLALLSFAQNVLNDATWRLRGLGADPAVILQLIQQSNFSKLGANGEVIKDERGKFLKGPNYWKPEPKIKEYLTFVLGCSGL